MKVRRRKRLKREREEAAKKLIDRPNVMEDYEYITTVRRANQWARHVMNETLHKVIAAQSPITVGLHVVWVTPSPPLQELPDLSDELLTPRRRRVAILQLSLPHTPVAVFHFTAMMTTTNDNSDCGACDDDDDEKNNNNLITNKDDDDDDDDPSDNQDEDRAFNEKGEFIFPIQVKKLLELSNNVICAIRVNELLNDLYQHEHIDCLSRVDIVDLANKALSYNAEGMKSPIIIEPISSALSKFNEPSLSVPEILDELCYYFLTVTDREQEMSFQRPVSESDPHHTTIPPQQQPMTDMIVKYYAAHVYHIRLLATLMFDMIDDGEEQFVHEDCDTVIEAIDPNIPFNPTVEQLPQTLCIYRKVAILMTDEEYESFMVDDDNDTGGDGNDKTRHPKKKSKRPQLRRHKYESKMTKSYSRKLLAIGRIEFITEPYGILRRLYNTSYLVGSDVYEDEVIVKLQSVKHPQFPILRLGCGEERYWEYPLPRRYDYGYPHEYERKAFQWPDEPTLGWVFKYALRPHIIVDRSRLVLFNQQEIVYPAHNPVKREDSLPKIPDDISKYL
jgi:hypothetical protein